MLAVETPESVGGRPRMFQDVEAFQEAINAYFSTKDAEERPYTMHGLARALGCSRLTLLNYENYTDAPGFVHAIKTARERVAEWTEDRLHQKGYHPAGAIFSLKNNFGWKDEQSVAVNVAVAVGIMDTDDTRRGLLPQLVIDQIRPENAIVPAVETTPVAGLSPQLETAQTLSPPSEIPVTVAKRKAKATPKRGVSPSRA